MHSAFLEREICHINLSDGSVSRLPIEGRLRQMLLGGRGINTLALLSFTQPGLDPLSPSAPIIIGNGLLSGIPGLCLDRTSITGISPESGLLGDSTVGGHFCVAMRRTPFDHIVITGEFNAPGIVLVKGSQVSLEEADWLWGKDAFETYDAIKKRYGKNAEALSIGPAGENLVRYAQVRADGRHAASRTGLGCTMGAKQIKAIIVMGPRRDLKAELFDRRRFVQSTKDLYRTVSDIDVIGHLRKRGTPYLYDIHNRRDMIRTKNATSAPLSNANALRSSRLVQEYYTSRSGCFSCPIRCQHRYRIPAGKYAGVEDAGIEYGTMGMLGPVVGVTDLDAVLAINRKLNSLGVDSCTLGNLIAATIELFKRGVITEKETEGLRLDWDQPDMVMRLAELIAKREGLGAILADGPIALVERYGDAVEDVLIWSKRLLASEAVDVRGYMGFALGVATATRGADHLRSRPTLEALNLSRKQLKELFGTDVSPDPSSSEGKPEMVRTTEALFAACDALGMCRFVVKFNSPDLLGFDEFAQYINAATDMDLTASDIKTIGQRINTVERLWLSRRAGPTNLNTLPRRIHTDPKPAGRFKGQRIERDEFAAVLAQFCEISGLDPATGAPLPETLRRLGIDDDLIGLVGVNQSK
ncbi:MAG: hypothetical protein JW941_09905 [Candidatus Coatesbacteria bacterium]|nr:hypothetical protein [Candidatus Coatesbacteria bacterium]